MRFSEHSVDWRVTAALLSLALLVGGAGLSFPLLQLLLNLAALVGLAYFLLHRGPIVGRYGRIALWILFLAIGLGLLQLLPLPPAVWEQLPGREPAVRLDTLIGSKPWRPLTLDPEGTIRALLVLIPALTIFVGTLRCDRKERGALIWLALAGGLLSAFLGALQAVTQGEFTPYPSAHQGFPIGLFVNRNHQAVLMLTLIPLTSALAVHRFARGGARTTTIAVALLTILFLAGIVVATTSRMALALTLPVLAISLAILFARQSLVRMIGPASLAVAGLTALVWFGGGLERNMTRFSSLNDDRVNYWVDMRWALENYGLAGTGFGSFMTVQKTAESLSNVTAAVLNHAHNDYIEILLEGGLPGILLALAGLALIGVATVRGLRRNQPREMVALRVAAVTGIASILVFSLVDYPLRMPAIAGVFAVLVGILLSSGKGGQQDSENGAGHRRTRVATYLAVVVTVGAAIVAVQAGVSAFFLIQGLPESAAQWAPWSSEAWSRSANNSLFVRHDPKLARDQALKALRLSPIDPVAIRTVGLVEEIAGDPAGSTQLLQLATSLGWRDMVANLWAIDASIRTGETQKAVERAEALYRQGEFEPAATAQILTSRIGDQAIPILARDLGENPVWRWGFLRTAGKAPEPSLPAFARLFMAVQQGPTPLRIIEARPLLDRLNTPELFPLRRRLWQELHAVSLLTNGGFDQTSSYRGPELPADWDISSTDLGSLSIEHDVADGHGNALRIVRPNPESPLIAQELILSPGNYLLSFRILSDGGSGDQLRWELRCHDNGQNINFDLPLSAQGGWQRRQMILTVPDRDCAQQRLALKLPTGDHGGSLLIDDVSLKQHMLTSG